MNKLEEERIKKGKNPVARDYCQSCNCRSYVHRYLVKENIKDRQGTITDVHLIGEGLYCPACAISKGNIFFVKSDRWQSKMLGHRYALLVVGGGVTVQIV